jgi:hypothetical protein
VLLDDLLWYRETSLLLGSTPEEIAAFVVPEGPPGFIAVVSDSIGPIDITELAEEYAGTEETTGDAVIQLQDLGFNAGHVIEFEVPDTLEWASIEVLEFADPAGAAFYLDDVRWGTEDAVDDVYTVADIDSAWGYSETFPSGETSRFVAFRSGSLVFYVGMTGVPGYTEDDVVAFAQTQVAYLDGGSASAANTPEDAIRARVEAIGERYVGDCAGADPSTDVGSYCSLLLEDHGSSRLYGVGPVASEITDRVTVTLEDGTWVVVD